MLGEVLDSSVSHMDMVRSVGRVGLAEYAAYLADLHRSYPNYWVKPTQVGARGCGVCVESGCPYSLYREVRLGKGLAWGLRASSAPAQTLPPRAVLVSTATPPLPPFTLPAVWHRGPPLHVCVV